MNIVRTRGPWLLALVAAWGISSVGGDCNSSTSTTDGGAGDGGGVGDGGGSGEGGPVAATCQGVCACLASACPDYPFLPDCITACQDPTNNPAWDLSCRASECSQAEVDAGAHCSNATGQTKCH